MPHWKWFQLFHLRKSDDKTQRKAHGKGSSDKPQPGAAEATHRMHAHLNSECWFRSSPHLRRQPEPVGEEDAPGASTRQRHRRPAGVVRGTERCHRGGGEAGAQQEEHGRRTRKQALNLGRHPWWFRAALRPA